MADENGKCLWVTLRADYFDSGLLGKAYRMQFQCPDFSNITRCKGYGISLLLTSDGGGYLLASHKLSHEISHIATPLKLKGNDTDISELSKQRSIAIDLVQFKDSCMKWQKCDEQEVLTAMISCDLEMLSVVITTMAGVNVEQFKFLPGAQVSELLAKIVELRPKWGCHAQIRFADGQVAQAHHLLQECTTLTVHAADVAPCEGTNKEACRIVDNLLDDIYDDMGEDWCLKLSGTKPDVKIFYDKSSWKRFTEAGGDTSICSPDEVSQVGDIVMTTPNCDELAHHLFRPTGKEVATTAMVNDAISEEMRAWEDILGDVELEVGDEIVVKFTFQSLNEQPATLTQGLIGTVKEIDDDGDAAVDFGAAFEEWQFVARSDCNAVAKRAKKT